MKILLVITKAEIGGAQAFVLNLARGLNKKGHEVVVAAGDGDFLSQELSRDNIKFLRIDNIKRSKNPLSSFLFIWELKKIIDKESFNVVHLNSTNTLPGVISACLSKKKPKTIFTVHGLSVLDKNYKASSLVKIIFKLYFKIFLYFIDKIVFVSKYNLIESAKQGIAKDGLVIYNGLNIDQNYFLDHLKARQALTSFSKIDLSDNYLIGSIGRLATQKNYDFLINIWPEIKKIKTNAKLIIIGEGPERNKYESLIKKLNLVNDIFLSGELKDASCLLKGLDLFILPSIYEGLSISLIEAILSDIPVLASDVGGNSEVIGLKNCYKLDDKNDLLFKLVHPLLIDIDKKQFYADNMVEKYLEVYE
jgi:glycosyltransferase involved in cell wall biosynthesis